MVNTLAKTTLREIRKSLGRYVAILAIIAIGVAIFSGLRMSEPAMIETGVVYLDEYSFYDFRLISTLGFTEEDVESFADLDGIELSRGSVFREFLHLQDSGDEAVLIAHSIIDGVNTPQLVSGRMPSAGNECLVDADMFSEKDIGTVIRLSDNNDEATLDLFAYDEYTIVGLANSPLYMNYERGSASIGSGTISAFALMPPEAFEGEIYYEIYLRLSQRADAYSDEYKPILDEVKPDVEHLLDIRASLRYEKLVSDANEEIAEAEKLLAEGWEEYRSGRAEAEESLAQALAQLEDGESEYADGLAGYYQGRNDYYTGLAQYEDGLAQLEEAEKLLAEGREEFEKAKAEVLAELDSALALLQDGEAQYADGMAQYEDGLAQLEEAEALIAENEEILAQAKNELNAAQIQLTAASALLAQARAPLDEAKAQLDEAKAQLDETAKYLNYFAQIIASAEERLSTLDPESAEYALLAQAIEGMHEIYDPIYAEYAAGLAQYNEGLAQYEAGMAQYQAGLAEYAEGLAQYNEGLAQYEEGVAQLEQAKADLEAGRQELEDSLPQLAQAREELDAGWEEYYSGKARADSELAAAQAELDEAQAEIDRGRAELADAQAQLSEALLQLYSAPGELAEARKKLDEGWEEYNSGKAEAEEEFAKAEKELSDGEAELADARSLLDELRDARTFTLTRSENVGYACFDSDTSIVAAISVVFPVFFFLVAALVCMTTMKRMVDEQRTQIGVLKAIGYGRGQIIGKYLFYSGSAAAIGCAIGYALGSTVLPLIMWEIYGMMYGFAPLEMVFNPALAALTFAASMLCSIGSTYFSCRAELIRPAAELIRPKTPKAGKRVFLERVGFVWKRLSFLQKVSVRNVLRYKSRFVMMVLGIGGCTALLVTGFGIRDSISNIAGDQYGEISLYDYSISFVDPLDRATADEYLDSVGFPLDSGIVVHSGSTDVVSENDSHTVYLVSPMDNSLEGFIDLHSGDEPIPFPAPGQVVINNGLADAMGISLGDTLILRDTDFGSVTVTVSGICDNYIYNYAFVSPQTYELQLGLSPEFNTLYVNSDSGLDPDEESVLLGESELVSSVTASATFRDRLTTTLERLNLIVVVVVVCSGALAFVVLYNLTNINITERVREIATVKVLGFYPGETATYVFREINILSCAGSLAGLFMGKWLHAFIMAQIQVEAMFFPCRIIALSYFLSFVCTILFTVLITNCMRGKLSRIDMAESLKSIE